MEKTKTERGFSLMRFNDLYGSKCSIQKSSLAEKDAIWLGIDDAQPQVLHGDAKRLGIETNASEGWIPYPIPEEVLLTTRMHLDRTQADKLVKILTRFVATGEI